MKSQFKFLTMKKKIVTLVCWLMLIAMTPMTTAHAHGDSMLLMDEKLDIKLKNDTGDEVTVYNAGGGGSYRLQKNIVTTIKMEAGDKLYAYDNGKKGRLLLTAAAEMSGKVQLYSKL
jgi:hypothetical protein